MDSIKINDLTFLRSAAARDNRVESAGIFKEKSLPMDGLSFDTLDADLYTDTLHESLRAVQAGAPVLVYRGEKQYARFVLEGLKRTGASSYHVTANSPMSALTSMPHPGGIYTGQTVEQVARDICGSVPVMVKSNLAGVKLYGWLPYATARDNLSQVLFAIGASLGTDLNGVLRVEPLWDGVASTVIPDRMYSGGSVEYGSAVSAVTVSEHQYVQGNEEKELFNGTTQAGDLITFDEPMHSLSATGFTILSSGANWAKLSAGSGVLTGKAYIHTTRQITETVTAGAAENIKTVKDATLVSLVNSVAVAKRLAEYYRCTETIKNPVVAGGEKPGHVVSIYHPYDKKMVRACISGADTTMSATLKSDLTALVGFKPPQVDTTEYYDERVVLTGNGSWTWPEGIATARAALCAAGQGGKCGEKGKPGGNASGQTGGNGGDGGKGGNGGSGGKVLLATIDIVPGTTVSYSCGVGGNGAVFNANNPETEGEVGGETIFGLLTSSTGQISETGFVDPITFEVYGRSGESGINGGAGGKGGYRTSTGAMALAKSGESVGLATGGPGGTFDYGSSEAYAAGGGGGGASAGANGMGGRNGDVSYADDILGTGPGWLSRPGSGGAGASAAINAPKASSYGAGGTGGNGGGGGGGGGAGAGKDVWYANGGTGGNGSDGGTGGDGCIILYFRKPKPEERSGPLMTRNGRMFLDKHGRRLIV